MNFISQIGRALLTQTNRTEVADRSGAAAHLPAATGASTEGGRSRSATHSDALPAQIPRPVPAAMRQNGQIVGNQTKLADLTRDFGDAAGKRLRLTPHADGTPEMHIHREGKINNPFTAGAKHQAAFNFMLDTVAREVGGDRVTAARILGENGCSLKGGVPCDRLKDIQQGVAIANIHRARAEASTPTNVAARAQAADQFLQARHGNGLDALVPPGTTARMSDTGMGGALKVKNAEGALVAVIKPDDAKNHAKAQFVEAMAAPLRAAGAMLGFPASERVTLSPAQTQGLKDIIGDADPTSVNDRAGKARQNIDDNGQVTRMQPAKGKDLSSLPLDERITLIKSGQLGRDLGYASVMCLMTGLSDHLSLNGSDESGTALVNMDNFIQGEDGMLHAIDPGVQERNGVHGAKPGEITSTIGNIRAMLEAANNAGSLEEFADNIIQQTKFNNSSNVLGAIISDILFTPGKQGFFKTQGEIDQLSQEDKRNLVLGMMQGMVKGLEFAQAHGNAIGAGYAGVATGGLQHHFGDNPQAYFTDLAGGFQTAVRGALAQKDAFEAKLGEIA
ncbi:MAG: hypothetical protein H6R18_393 [Proteobacteria bacterium]|nr:hypothetical protein [Pseudomonadota bacterium]